MTDELATTNGATTAMARVTDIYDPASFDHLWRIGQALAASSLVPEHFRGKGEDCFLAAELAKRLEVHPFMLLQSLYIVHGKPGMEAKLVIALVNKRGPFTGPIQYELTGEGDTRACRAFATHAETGDVCDIIVDMSIAKAEGWMSNKKWTTMPDLMLRYRSAAWLARAYCPEVIMGMHTTDELDDMRPRQAFDHRRAIGGREIVDEPTPEQVAARAAFTAASKTEPDKSQIRAPEPDPPGPAAASGGPTNDVPESTALVDPPGEAADDLELEALINDRYEALIQVVQTKSPDATHNEADEAVGAWLNKRGWSTATDLAGDKWPEMLSVAKHAGWTVYLKTAKQREAAT